MKKFTVLACLAALVIIATAHTADEWKSRVIYQILTDRFAKDTDDDSPCADLTRYCGGTFNGIIRKLDYLQGLGVNAIWISPIPENTDHGYHGYWQKNLHKVNPFFGTSDDLKRLIKECHDRDIWVMLDVVGNHMGYQNVKDPNDFSMFTPFNKPEHYHEDCPLYNYGNQHEVENCRLAGLPDLDQSHSFVSSALTKWVQDTVKEFGFDGLRVDTTHMVSKEFWLSYSKASGVYTVGEVFNTDPGYISGYQDTALDALLDYSMYYKLKDVFMYKQHMGRIHDGVEEKKIFPDSTVLASFLDNHDNDRFLNVNRDWTLLKNALAYIVYAEGIPVIYYGTEQGFTGGHDPANRESLWPHYNTGHWLYIYISTIVKFRVQQGEKLYEAKQVERYVDEHFFAFSRGKVFVATTNVGSGGSLSRTITYHPYKDGTKLEDILRPSYVTTVKEGRFTVLISNGQPRIYRPTDLKEYKESGVCYEDGERKECGVLGINQQKCEEKGCCWSPLEGKNWCFHKTKETDGREEL